MNALNKSNWKTSWIWLLIGFIFLSVSNGTNQIIPLATWMAPVFLLRFLRTQRKLKGLLLLLPIHILGWFIMTRGMYYEGMPYIVDALTAVSYGVIFYLPYLLDRLLSSKIKGFYSTLIFPMIWVIVEFILLSSFYTGSWFSLAYTQRDFLPLIQMVSVTGIVGISFMITWFSSVINWMWEQKFSLKLTIKGASLYVVILMVIVLLGSAYMVFDPADSQTIRAAAITRSFDIDDEVKRITETTTESEYDEAIRKMLRRSLDEFLLDSQIAADAGAKLIVWQENGVAVREDDETEYIEIAQEFAVREEVYLIMGLKMSAKDRTQDENKSVLIEPSGQVTHYFKNHISPGDTHVLGEGKVLTKESVYGNIATVICKDFEYPKFMRQAGKAGVDMMLIPSHDWEGITPVHAKIANFRAIENGYMMISANYHGLSTAVDYHGNYLAQMNDFKTDERIMFADLPSKGTTTLYSVVGDLFAWICVVGFVLLIGISFIGKRRQK